MKKEEEKATEFLTLQEVAERLRISRPTVRNLIRDGKLAAVRAGKRVFRISVTELEDFINDEHEQRR